MKLFLQFFCVLFFTYALYSQNMWEKISTPYDITPNAFTYDSKYTYTAVDSILYRSVDELTWENCKVPVQKQEYIQSSAVQNEILFVGTSKGRIYKSTDNGNGWTISINLPDSSYYGSYTSISKIYAKNNKILVLINDSFFFEPLTYHGIYLSDDSGNHWKRIYNGFLYNIYFSFADDIPRIFALAESALYMSTDFGLNWQKKGNKVVTSVVMKDEVLYGSVFNNYLEAKLMKSTDYGEAWVDLTDKLPVSSYQYDLFLDENNNIVLLLMSSVEVYKTQNQGESWQLAYLPQINLINSISYKSNSVYALCMNNGLYKLIDGEWVNLNLPGHRIQNFKSMQCNTTGIFAGSADGGGIFKSTDKGNTWELVNYAQRWWNDIGAVLHKDNQGFIYTVIGRTIKKTLNGEEWITIGNLPDTIEYSQIQAFRMNSKGHFFIGCYLKGLWRTTDSGKSWTELKNGLTHNDIRSLAVGDQDVLLAGTAMPFFGSGGIFISKDNGESWNKINNGIQNNYPEILSLYIDPQGQFFAGTGDGIYRSTDEGANWVYSENTNYHDVESFISLPDGKMYACASWLPNIYESQDNGVTWTEKYNGIPYDVYVYDMTFDDDGFLYAAASDGLYRSVGSVTSVKERNENIPKEFSLDQNYPNPFNPATTISFSIPQQTFVSLKVYDMLGDEICSIVNEYKSAGEYDFSFNAGELSSGVYLYTLRAGSYNQTRKMIVLK